MTYWPDERGILEMALRVGKLAGTNQLQWLRVQRDIEWWHAERETSGELRQIKQAATGCTSVPALRGIHRQPNQPIWAEQPVQHSKHDPGEGAADMRHVVDVAAAIVVIQVVDVPAEEP